MDTCHLSWMATGDSFLLKRLWNCAAGFRDDSSKKQEAEDNSRAEVLAMLRNEGGAVKGRAEIKAAWVRAQELYENREFKKYRRAMTEVHIVECCVDVNKPFKVTALSECRRHTAPASGESTLRTSLTVARLMLRHAGLVMLVQIKLNHDLGYGGLINYDATYKIFLECIPVLFFGTSGASPLSPPHTDIQPAANR